MQRHRKPHWFKRKWYGRGWYPVTRQGWVITFLFLLMAVAWGTTLPVEEEVLATMGWREYLGMYLPFLVMIGGLVCICYLRGEKPRWQWGAPREDC